MVIKDDGNVTPSLKFSQIETSPNSTCSSNNRSFIICYILPACPLALHEGPQAVAGVVVGVVVVQEAAPLRQ